MEAARDPRWLIGSAAIALHGVPVEVADIDLLTSVADAERLFGERLAPAPPSGLFRSERFGRWSKHGIAVELMAGLRLYRDGAWRDIFITGRVAVPLGVRTLYTPGVPGLLALCRMFDRPKDRTRAALLEKAIKPPAGDR